MPVPVSKVSMIFRSLTFCFRAAFVHCLFLSDHIHRLQLIILIIFSSSELIGSSCLFHDVIVCVFLSLRNALSYHPFVFKSP